MASRRIYSAQGLKSVMMYVGFGVPYIRRRGSYALIHLAGGAIVSSSAFSAYIQHVDEVLPRCTFLWRHITMRGHHTYAVSMSMGRRQQRACLGLALPSLQPRTGLAICAAVGWL